MCLARSGGGHNCKLYCTLYDCEYYEHMCMAHDLHLGHDVGRYLGHDRRARRGTQVARQPAHTRRTRSAKSYLEVLILLWELKDTIPSFNSDGGVESDGGVRCGVE